MKTQITKKAALAILAASLALTACSGSGNTSAPVETTKAAKAETTAETKKETQAETKAEAAEIGRTDIVVGVSSDIRSMDPAEGVDTPSATLNMYLYNGLVKIDENKQIVGDLAESFEMVDDLTYKFKLKEGVLFHNGEELKASDVKFTFERCKTMPRAMSNADAIDHVTVEGDYECTVHMSRPYPSFLYMLNSTSMRIVSEKAVTEAGDTYGEKPVGTGPFKFKEWVANDHWTLERFDDYFEGPVIATSITTRVIPEGSARCIALETGEVDLILNVDPTDAVNIESNPELVLESNPAASVEYIGMNTQKEALSDVRVRQAISYAIDRQEFVDIIMEGRGEVATSFIPSTIPGWNEDVHPYPRDLEKAKELLAEAGYADGLDLSIYVSGDVRNRSAQLVQAQLKEAGIELDINIFEWGAFQELVNSGAHDLLILGWANSTCDPEYSIVPLFHSKNWGASGNRAYLKDDELDAMIDAISVETDQEARLQGVKDIQTRLNELCPWVPLYTKYDMVGRRADLKGFVFNKNVALHSVGNCYYEK